jgi:hypothetical protein
MLDGKPLRASRKLPLARNQQENLDFYHEALVSFLVAGVDEWVWTAECYVDTYFGSEPENSTYLEGEYGSDPATGGFTWLRYPVWNPREYFLIVLARRVMQVKSEWSALITEFDNRLLTYVSLTANGPIETKFSCAERSCRKITSCAISSTTRNLPKQKN